MNNGRSVFRFEKPRALARGASFILIFCSIFLFFAGNSRSEEIDHSTKYMPCPTDDQQEAPWLTHIDTKINTTFDSAVNEYSFLDSMRCAGDETDVGKTPFGPIKPVCLQGEGAKMVIPITGFKKTPSLVFSSPAKGGLFEQEHMVKSTIPAHFFSNKKAINSTKYFLIPFDTYEVPTYFSIVSKIYLPVWKKVFQAFNSIGDAYFDSHIYVVGSSAYDIDRDGKKEKVFSVTYYFHVDWVKVRLTDSFVYSLEGIDDHVTAEELLGDENVAFGQAKFKRAANIKKLQPITSVVSKEHAKKAVKDASLVLRFNESGIVLDKDGALIMRLTGMIDDSANRCLSATLVLESGKVIEIQEMPCSFY